MKQWPDDDINVACVCDSNVAIYGHANNGLRPFITSYLFTNYGQAKFFADEYETNERIARARVRRS